MSGIRIITTAWMAGALLAVAKAVAAEPNDTTAGAVYTMDNSSAENHIFSYTRAANGGLNWEGSFSTGGRGTGAGLGSQGSIALSADGKWLFACNAGSHEISAFAVSDQGPVLVSKVPSQGLRPISLTVHHDLLFVLNSGGLVGAADSIAGFHMENGELQSIPAATHGLSSASTDPAQIGFSANGDVLVVTEKATGIIDTFTIEDDGTITQHQEFQSVGQTPFGFALRGNLLVISEAFGGAADASAASSYILERDGTLRVVTGSAATTESSACWAVITGNGRYSYTANTGSGSITGFHISRSGELTLLNSDGATARTGVGSAPADMALSRNSRFLFSRNGNGTIAGFGVAADGSLQPVALVNGIPAGAAGLAAR